VFLINISKDLRMTFAATTHPAEGLSQRIAHAESRDFSFIQTNF
jgi:hypothetical protein